MVFAIRMHQYYRQICQNALQYDLLADSWLLAIGHWPFIDFNRCSWLDEGRLPTTSDWWRLNYLKSHMYRLSVIVFTAWNIESLEPGTVFLNFYHVKGECRLFAFIILKISPYTLNPSPCQQKLHQNYFFSKPFLNMLVNISSPSIIIKCNCILNDNSIYFLLIITFVWENNSYNLNSEIF